MPANHGRGEARGATCWLRQPRMVPHPVILEGRAAAILIMFVAGGQRNATRSDFHYESNGWNTGKEAAVVGTWKWLRYCRFRIIFRRCTELSCVLSRTMTGESGFIQRETLPLFATATIAKIGRHCKRRRSPTRYLRDMARIGPVTNAQFLAVQRRPVQQLDLYGQRFIQTIASFNAGGVAAFISL